MVYEVLLDWRLGVGGVGLQAGKEEDACYRGAVTNSVIETPTAYGRRCHVGLRRLQARGFCPTS